MNIEKLREYFGVQFERGVTNLYFMTKETSPSVPGEWQTRAFPADQLEELLGHLKNYTYYRTTTHIPRFFRTQNPA